MGEKNQLNRMIEHIKSEYGADPEFLWPNRYPSYAVFRHDDNKKWFALIGAIKSKSRWISPNQTNTSSRLTI